ncbi:MAG: SDR family NAD(P)-dependent oxidoreductase, partial [Gammaproteobacteria bacterium]
MKLDDKVAIVTGAGRGIGKAIAVAFAAEGAKVVSSARTGREIDAVARETDGLAVECDVANEISAKRLIDATLDAFGRIDILVNNAGAVARELTHELAVEDWDNVINVNLRGTFLCTKFALPSMLERGAGC